MQVRWLATALRNLEDEAEYVARENPEAARARVQRTSHAVERLKEHPALGRPGRIHGTRELVVSGTRHVIPYRVRPRLHRIEILRVFHASRRPPERW